MNNSEPPRGDLTTLYLRNRYLLVLAIIVFIIAGVAAIVNLPRLEDPRITLRNATISTFSPGASATRIEALINEKIEETLAEIEEIKTLASTARTHVSSIQIELAERVTRKTNQEVFAKIRSRLQNIQNDLPVDASIPFLDDMQGATAYTTIVGVARR